MCEVTPKQEAFLQGLMEGKSQRQSYIDAYPNASEWSPESVDSRASNLLKNDKVLTRYQELQAEARESGKVRREDVLAELSSIGFASLEDNRISVKDKISALALIAKICGFEQSQKQQIDVNMNQKSKLIIEGVDDGRGGYE